MASPYSVAWDTTAASNGNHTLTATASDAAGNQSTSAVAVVISNFAANDDVLDPSEWRRIVSNDRDNRFSTEHILRLDSSDRWGWLVKYRECCPGGFCHHWK